MTIVRLSQIGLIVAVLCFVTPMTKLSSAKIKLNSALVSIGSTPKGTKTPDEAAVEMTRAHLTRSPMLFMENLCLGVCDGPVNSINKYAESLHLTSFSRNSAAVSIYDLPKRGVNFDSIQVNQSKLFDKNDKDIAHLIAISTISTYYGEEFMAMEVQIQNKANEQYTTRVVVTKVNERWFALPRCRSSEAFYKIADTMEFSS